MTPEFITCENLWINLLRITLKIFIWLGILGSLVLSFLLGGFYGITEIEQIGTNGVLAYDRFNFLVFFTTLPFFGFITFLITVGLKVILNMAVRLSKK